jgi:hypothetical protein
LVPGDFDQGFKMILVAHLHGDRIHGLMQGSSAERPLLDLNGHRAEAQRDI